MIGLASAFFLLFGCAEPAPETNAATHGDWATYLGDNARRHYSDLDQITRDNVHRLELAWKYDSGPLRGEASTMYTSPLVVDGVLYGLSPKLVVFALNAATGEELWRTDLDLAGAAQRGLMWWSKAGDRRVLFTHGADLYALNADDGALIGAFGDNGKVDLQPAQQPDGYIAVTVPGVIFKESVIVGFSTSEGRDAVRGSIRAFSVIDGELLWTFNTVPAPGEPGSETWAEGAYEKAGGANVWTGMALDEARGILFAPTGSATPDFYGADRIGDNLYANALLALNAQTGRLLWHYQNVRHDLWDRDNPSPPTLVQIERHDKLIDAVALTTKSGHLYLFDRDSGESLYPIEEVPVPASVMPNEVAAKFQPVSTVAFTRQQFEITQRSDAATRFVAEQVESWDQRPWAPPRIGTVLLYPWYDGGAEWGGSAFDPATRRLILNANDAAGVLELSEVPIGFSNYAVYAKHCGSCHGLQREGTDAGPPLTDVVARLGAGKVFEVVANGVGRMPGFAHLTDAERRGVYRYLVAEEPIADEPTSEVDYILAGYVNVKDHEGLPGNSPPWGTLNSIDLATGELVWQIPFGNYLTHPDLNYGAINYGGPVVTKSGLVFIAATPDKLFKAYDAATGAELWRTELSAAGFATPAVYSVDGKQYVAIAAGGGRLGPPSGSEYYAYTLP